MEKTIRKFKSVVRFLMRTHGQDLIEYVLLLSLIALAATVGMKSLATSLNAAFVGTGTKISTYVTSGGGGGGNNNNNNGGNNNNNNGGNNNNNGGNNNNNGGNNNNNNGFIAAFFG